jgi:hypothetical protein
MQCAAVMTKSLWMIDAPQRDADVSTIVVKNGKALGSEGNPPIMRSKGLSWLASSIVVWAVVEAAATRARIKVALVAVANCMVLILLCMTFLVFLVRETMRASAMVRNPVPIRAAPNVEKSTIKLCACVMSQGGVRPRGSWLVARVLLSSMNTDAMR